VFTPHFTQVKSAIASSSFSVNFVTKTARASQSITTMLGCHDPALTLNPAAKWGEVAVYDPFDSSADPFDWSDDPFDSSDDPFDSSDDPFDSSDDPFDSSDDPFNWSDDPSDSSKNALKISRQWWNKHSRSSKINVITTHSITHWLWIYR